MLEEADLLPEGEVPPEELPEAEEVSVIEVEEVHLEAVVEEAASLEAEVLRGEAASIQEVVASTQEGVEGIRHWRSVRCESILMALSNTPKITSW